MLLTLLSYVTRCAATPSCNGSRFQVRAVTVVAWCVCADCVRVVGGVCTADNQLGADGATAVGDALRGHTDLTSLDMGRES